MTPVSAYGKPVREEHIFPYGHWGSEMVSHSNKVTQLGGGRVWIQPWIIVFKATLLFLQSPQCRSLGWWMHSISLVCEYIFRRLPYIFNNWYDHIISCQPASFLLQDADKKERAEWTQENPTHLLADFTLAQSYLLDLIPQDFYVWIM